MRLGFASWVVLVVSGCSQITERAHYPGFNWHTVPLFAQLGKTTGDFTMQEAEFLANHFKVIALEKTQGLQGSAGSVEDAIYRAARQLKAINPETKVMFYLDTFMNYPMFESSEEFRAHAQWALKDKEGKAVVIADGLPNYDLTKPEVREWLIRSACESVGREHIDGIFADSISTVVAGASWKRQAWGNKKYDDLEASLRLLLADMRREIGPDKLLIYNGLFGEKGWWSHGGMPYLEHASGTMVEHFAALSARDRNGNLKPENLAWEIEMIGQAARQGKIVMVKGFPGNLTWMPSARYDDLSDVEKMKLARERITFPLAAFLVAAEEYCYFGYSWGYLASEGWLQWYPEFDQPLGPPKGAATRIGWVYTREFEHASVWVDLEHEDARIDWHEPSACLGHMRADSSSTLITRAIE